MSSVTKGVLAVSNLKKGVVVCIECLKVSLQVGLVAEGSWKLFNGGMNDISPWRQASLNRMFPDDRTNI